MKIKNTYIYDLRDFLILWSTQSLSQLGSSMTAFALTLWLYEETGSALKTATLTICSYAPYVIMSIFAGALSDRFDKKKTMLVCDLLAALSTMTVLVLYLTNNLVVWHLYAVNAVSGLMNTVQQPASEVATTLLIPKKQYQRASGLQSLSRSLISILNPLFATALYGLAGLELVIALDLGSFVVAFLALFFLIKIPDISGDKNESILILAKGGIEYLKNTPMILTMILFMSGINLVASAFDAVLPGFVIPNPKGGYCYAWCSDFLCGDCHDFRKYIGVSTSKTKESYEGRIYHHVDIVGYRELYDGILSRTLAMVSWSSDWLDSGSGNECEL